ncbi:META domain-containing protein [Endozoicomonas gorgoniicola]|uniref:META domain-containing protein n=1 Tax=Endozoicomonas gorgoniicola TaxID=1234144 RepID=A0ABT3MY16_9GAMM|nr:META domain-containing protein [Endozoicomonas gorgoniicola]MCW7554259.1 META domain-containing protein [Endozoicomonas gorgoniicola]
MRTIGRFATVLTVSSMLAACSSTHKPVVVTPDMLQGQIWVMSSLNGEAPVGGKRITMELTQGSASQGKVNGRGPCNSYFGGYQIEQGQVSFGRIGSSMMACREPVMQQEMAFHTTLQKTNQMLMDDRMLILKEAGGQDSIVFMAETGRVRGEVHSSTGSFPRNSQMMVRLIDVSKQDTHLQTIGEQKIKIKGEVLGPVAFDLPYAPHLIKAGHTYAISVEVRQHGKLLYTSRSHYPLNLDKAALEVKAEPIKSM